jgi:hypothetical protein
MEPGGSLPCSQELSTGPYPEPDQSSPYHPILFLKIHLNIKRRIGYSYITETSVLYHQMYQIEKVKVAERSERAG